MEDHPSPVVCEKGKMHRIASWSIVVTAQAISWMSREHAIARILFFQVKRRSDSRASGPRVDSIAFFMSSALRTCRSFGDCHLRTHPPSHQPLFGSEGSLCKTPQKAFRSTPRCPAAHAHTSSCGSVQSIGCTWWQMSGGYGGSRSGFADVGRR
ncbi:uncharacterized protein B0I36DRAFT_327091 [Microdochium trichocladiopsis]|uniref:Uncharacterized protein n=1 Tax=Microdochium trichocladiopsis TaxID=1682393 RepID=A0A9P9BKW1_9PEZI|nr:uncharacterized protein B0I36DRAFT_327091 [Microdochium trichocladiopsis]KAH7027442.1 hypothetical protein B0I36DRAFT_327091 [Microdochium trichocladiopsis]